MKKKMIAAMLCLSMAAAMTACGGNTAAPAATEAAKTEAAQTEAAPADDAQTEAAPADASAFDSLDPVTLVVGSAAASSNNIYTVMDQLAQEVSEKTNGKLTLDLVWDGALGNDSELLNSCIMGDIDISFVATSSFSNTCPEMAIFDIPGMFDSVVDAQKAISTMTNVLDPYLNAYDIKLLGLSCNNFRGLSTNVNIQTPDDFKGMKIRTPENKYYQAFYSNLGCQPTPLAFGELYTALQQGLVDAQDNPAEAVYATKFYEVQDYFMDPHAITYVFPISINLGIYNSLDPAYQEMLKWFAEEYAVRCAACSEDVANASIEAMGDNITVLELTDDLHEAIVTAGAPIADMVRADVTAEVVDQYLAAAAEVNGN